MILLSEPTNPQPKPMKKLRILIADDHEVVRAGVRAMVENEPDFEVCGIATNGREAVALATELKPDIVIVDMTMPELDGVQVVRQIKRALPQTEMLVFSAHESESIITEVFVAGAKSYIRKTDAGRHLISALRSLQQHKPFFTDNVSKVLFTRFLKAADKQDTSSSEKLSTRERQIVRLLAEGKSNKENALALGISIRTIETHRATVMRKLRLTSLADLVRYAIRNGIVEA
jgi:two-component system, NarL family, response regulator NreC